MVKCSHDSEKGEKKDAKNMKNFYVKKINSLVNTSSEFQSHAPVKNQIRRTNSAKDELDRVCQRRQKNRESAKRARDRKKLYVQLLQRSVERLDRINREGEEALKESDKFLKTLETKKSQKIKLEGFQDVFSLGQISEKEEQEEFYGKKNEIKEITKQIENLVRPKPDFSESSEIWSQFIAKIQEKTNYLSQLTQKVELLKDQNRDSHPLYFPEQNASEKLLEEYQTFLMNQTRSHDSLDFRSGEALECLMKIEIFTNKNLEV